LQIGVADACFASVLGDCAEAGRSAGVPASVIADSRIVQSRRVMVMRAPTRFDPSDERSSAI
jgi:hypothetical protein